MKRIRLCADDFGLNPSVNDAILSLVGMERLNAVSCMSVGEHFDEAVEDLKKATQTASVAVEVGLHLTFTQYTSITGLPQLETNGRLPEIGSLLIKSHLRMLNRSEIKKEIKAQLQKFIDVFGTEPDFIDGHQHAHLLPIIRDALLEVASDQWSKDGWIRNCHQPVKTILQSGISQPRSLLIAFLSKPLKRMLRRAGIMANDLFLGVNNFDRSEPYNQLMKTWLAQAAQFQGTILIMCHPGSKSGDQHIKDPISERRESEFEYLSSNEFAQVLKRFELTLGA